MFVAGLCSSVAHLAELEQFLEATRSIPNIAFAIVLQNREALDVEGFTTRVTTATGHPVEAISDGQPVEAGHIHLAPEGTKVTLEGRRFKTEPAEGKVGQRGETDSFLVSLADEMREKLLHRPTATGKPASRKGPPARPAGSAAPT